MDNPLLPPVARRAPGPDPYAWMHDRTLHDPTVLAHLHAEQAHTDAVLAPLSPLRGRLYDEMVSRMRETDQDVPYPKGAYQYYDRVQKGAEYHVLCRTKGDGPEEVLLDLNALAVGNAFLTVDVYEVSDVGDLLAYSVDTVGDRRYTLRVKDLTAGTELPLAVPRVDAACWAADGKTLYYVVEDPVTKRAHRLYRHRLGTDTHELLYDEQDERFVLGLERTRSGAFVIVTSVATDTTEVRVFPADDPNAAAQVIIPRTPGIEAWLDHDGTRFILRTNADGAREFQILRAAVSDDPVWEPWIPHREDVYLEGVELFARHAVLEERAGGQQRLAVLDLETGERHELSFPEAAYAVEVGVNEVFDTSELRVEYESFITPRSVYAYDVATRAMTLLKREDVPGGYDPSLYVVERLEATASDGALVPITLLRRKDAVEPAPMLLYGYGSYGISLDPGFNPNRFCLVDRGVAFAMAHIRGGSELGRRWYDEGKLRNKPNTFSDFASCAEHLVSTGRTRPELLAAKGASAGGLLMGAVLNLRPELFRAVILGVPFVDVLATMSDPTLPLTVGEYLEWGDPNDPDDRAVMASYCPLTNLAPRPYPAMLLRASLYDSQVPYWEAAKYAAMARTCTTSDAPVLLDVNMDAGHGGASGRYQSLEEAALECAFLLWQLGRADA